MAGMGVGETMLLSAALGGGSAALSGKDPLKGALLGGALGGLGAGAGSLFGAAEGTGTALAAGEIAAPTAAELAGMGYTPTQITDLLGAGAGAGAGVGGGGITDLLKSGASSVMDFAKAHPYMTAAGVGIPYLMSMERKKYGIPENEPYTGPLSYFKYDPRQFTPTAPTPPMPPYRAQYAAEGGIMGMAQGGLNAPTGPVERMSQNIVGAGGMYPQSQMDKTYFATPTQMPASAEVIGADYDARTNPYTGTMMAEGGIASLKEGSFVVPADVVSHLGNGSTDAGIAALSTRTGAKPIRGRGDGMSDSIATSIDGRQRAQVADGEAVIEPEQVRRIGKGSSKAGAKKLYSMMDKVRQARTGTTKQGRQINPAKYMPA